VSKPALVSFNDTYSLFAHGEDHHKLKPRSATSV
jgi:hypothetical protein